MENGMSFNGGANKWMYVNSRDKEAVDRLIQQYGLGDEMLAYALDKNEQARVEQDLAHQALLVVYNAPVREKKQNHYVTHPITFIIKENNLFTFYSKELEYLIPMLKEMLTQLSATTAQAQEGKNDDEFTEFSLLFHCLFLISESFFPLIEEVTKERTKLNEKLIGRTKNQYLLELSDLSIGLVYLVSATKQNVSLLETIKGQEIYHEQMNLEEKEELRNTLTEARQADEMVQLSSQILEQLSSAYNNIVNNNLNDTMKILTVWSLILTIPTIVTGFFGMNMFLPLADYQYGWLFALLISVGLSLFLLFILWRKIK